LSDLGSFEPFCSRRHVINSRKHRSSQIRIAAHFYLTTGGDPDDIQRGRAFIERTRPSWRSTESWKNC
jgi:hypothetical protein